MTARKSLDNRFQLVLWLTHPEYSAKAIAMNGKRQRIARLDYYWRWLGNGVYHMRLYYHSTPSPLAAHK